MIDTIYIHEPKNPDEIESDFKWEIPWDLMKELDKHFTEPMQKHTKIYLDYFDYGENDFIPYECCQGKSVDIHHINGRGKNKDVISNLMAVCRKCHERLHSTVSKGEAQLIHNNFLAGNRKQFLC